MSAQAPPRPIATRRRRLRRCLQGGRRGIAAVEFALVAPLLLLLFGGIAELGLTVWARSTLTDAVSQGAYYAFLTGPSVQTSAITTLVQNASGLSGISAGATTPATYCASGSPATLTAATSSGTCSDGTTPGTYTTITATYSMTPILPAFTGLGTSQLKESVTVRLQ